jgi:hypothetical protein
MKDKQKRLLLYLKIYLIEIQSGEIHSHHGTERINGYFAHRRKIQE